VFVFLCSLGLYTLHQLKGTLYVYICEMSLKVCFKTLLVKKN